MRYYFDTSAISALYADIQRDAVNIDQITHGNQILVSAINIVEAVATEDGELRRGLLKLIKGLLNGYRPLALPSEMLRYSLEDYLNKSTEINWSIREEQEGIWILLNKPELADDRDRIDKMLKFKDEEENWYRDIHEKARPAAQEIRKKRGDPFKTPLKFIKSYCNNEDFLEDVFGNLFRSLGYADELKGKAKHVLTQFEPWKFYYGAMAHGIYDRAIQKEGFGHKKTPGGLDTQQAIYLACCNSFITRDRPQYKVLRSIVKLGNIKRQVLWYDHFKMNKLF